MAIYCFAERREELFREALGCGFLCAVLDWPGRKSAEASLLAAIAEAREMKAQVCCVPVGEHPYYSLIMTGWVSGYRVIEDLTERELVYQKSILARASVEEARAVLRRGMAESETVKEAWVQFCALVR